MGVFSAEVQPDHLGEGRMLRWHQAPGGHHIELGISEMNLFCCCTHSVSATNSGGCCFQ